MDFSVEFYETAAGGCPVQDFLDELKASDPDDFAAIVAGLAKLRHRQYHREPLSKALGGGLREQAGLSQKELARRLKTSQQQISRLESPDYEGHSLASLRRVAEVLHARVRVVFEPDEKGVKRVAQPVAPYRVKRASAK